MNYQWILYVFIAIMLVQGTMMVMWPHKFIQFQVWQYKRFIGAEVDPGGRISLWLCRLTGAGMVAMGTFVLLTI
jgi:hypothetical protein